MTILESRAPEKGPHFEHRRSRLTWGLAIVLAIALVALAGVTVALVNQDEQAAAPETAAQTNYPGVSEEVERMLDDRIAAMNTGDSARAASHYAPNGTLAEFDQNPPYVSEGRAEIDARLLELYNMGMRIAEVGDPIQVGPYVAEPTVIFGAGESTPTPSYENAFMLLFDLGKDGEGKITYQWVIHGWEEMAAFIEENK